VIKHPGLLLGNEHQNSGLVRAERAVAPQPQLQRQLKVPRRVDDLRHRHHAAAGQALRREEGALVAAGDDNLDVIAGHGVGGAHAEDVGEDGDVGGEGEVVVGYSQGRARALERLIARQAFASTAERRRRRRRRRAGPDRKKQGTERRRKRERGRETRCKYNVPCMACSGRNISSTSRCPQWVGGGGHARGS